MLAAFTGLAQSLQLAIPPCRLYLRSLYDTMSSKKNWESDVKLSKQALRDLSWWAALEEQRFLQRAIYREATTATLYTDASMSGWGGVLNKTAFVHGIWSKAESASHITHLELRGVLNSVKALLPRLSHRRTLLFVDNQAVVYIIRNFTSRSPVLMAELRGLVGICETANATLDVQWVPTDRNLADEPSRRRAPDHWKLDPSVFSAACARFRLAPTVDRFATAATRLLPRWNSPCPEPGAEGVDGLSQAWEEECNWVHPPLHLLPEVATKLERGPATGIVVTPFWPAEQWFQTLRGLATESLVVPHCRSLVCPFTLRTYGVNAQGDWPLVFWRLAPALVSTQAKLGVQYQSTAPPPTWRTQTELLFSTPLLPAKT